eukprot:scaffold113263_cov15-Tisochrysis_lutea.AAC.1
MHAFLDQRMHAFAEDAYVQDEALGVHLHSISEIFLQDWPHTFVWCCAYVKGFTCTSCLRAQKNVMNSIKGTKSKLGAPAGTSVRAQSWHQPKAHKSQAQQQSCIYAAAAAAAATAAPTCMPLGSRSGLSTIRLTCQWRAWQAYRGMEVSKSERHHHACTSTQLQCWRLHVRRISELWRFGGCLLQPLFLLLLLLLLPLLLQGRLAYPAQL